jgi:hypothetical protein
MEPSHPSGFWGHGEDQLAKALDEEEARAMAPLQDALRRNMEDRKKINAQIAEIRERFRHKRKEARRFLFAR